MGFENVAEINPSFNDCRVSNPGILEDLRPDRLGDTYSSFTFPGLPTLEEKRDLEVCNVPSLPASNGGVVNNVGAVKRDICELPSLDLSLLPPRELMGAGSFTCRHKGRPSASAQQYFPVPFSLNADVFRSKLCRLRY